MINKIQMKFQIELDGLYNDTMISEVISAVISDLAPEVFETYKPQLLTVLEKSISEVVNHFLGDMSLTDIINIINGGKMAEALWHRNFNVDWKDREHFLNQIMGVFNHRN